MPSSDDSLDQAFLEDHRHMTRGFWRLRQALESGDWPGAVDLAEEIDRLVGPHMEFEETVYYPTLAQVLGETQVAQLYQEHRIGLSVIEELLGGDRQPPEAAVREDLVRRVGETLKHAQTCGTLLSHLARLPQADQDRLLGRLREIRERGQRWRDFARAGESSTTGGRQD